jgi:hypothetical protein
MRAVYILCVCEVGSTNGKRDQFQAREGFDHDYGGDNQEGVYFPSKGAFQFRNVSIFLPVDVDQQVRMKP